MKIVQYLIDISCERAIWRILGRSTKRWGPKGKHNSDFQNLSNWTLRFPTVNKETIPTEMPRFFTKFQPARLSESWLNWSTYPAPLVQLQYIIKICWISLMGSCHQFWTILPFDSLNWDLSKLPVSGVQLLPPQHTPWRMQKLMPPGRKQVLEGQAEAISLSQPN